MVFIWKKKKTILPPTFLSVLQHLLRVENQCDSSLNRFSWAIIFLSLNNALQKLLISADVEQVLNYTENTTFRIFFRFNSCFLLSYFPFRG